MYDAAAASQLKPETPDLQRVKGAARVRFACSNGTTRLADLYQKGSAKVRLPKVYDSPATAVLINTAGGLTGGDELSYKIEAAQNTHAIVTSQTAERAYRSLSGSAKVTGSLTVGPGATLEWLPQETILFDRSCLSRTLTAELAEDARLMMLETVIVGRTAMNETIATLAFKDRWRIRRGGKLIFADDVRLTGRPDNVLAGPATAAGGHVFATFADVHPDAEDRLAGARTCLENARTAAASHQVAAAVSAWNGLLTARFVSNDSRALRKALISFLTGYRAAELPRVWSC